MKETLDTLYYEDVYCGIFDNAQKTHTWCVHPAAWADLNHVVWNGKKQTKIYITSHLGELNTPTEEQYLFDKVHIQHIRLGVRGGGEQTEIKGGKLREAAHRSGMTARSELTSKINSITWP